MCLLKQIANNFITSMKNPVWSRNLLFLFAHEEPNWRSLGNIMNESLSAGSFGSLRYPAQAQFSLLIETPNWFSNNTPL